MATKWNSNDGPSLNLHKIKHSNNYRKRCRIDAAEMGRQQEVVACWLLNIETNEDFPSPSITLVSTRILPLRFPPFNPFGTETGRAIVLQKWKTTCKQIKY